MPKLDGTHIAERLKKRIAELEAGEELAAKDIRALLSPEQYKAYENALERQDELRFEKRARTEEEKKAFGWKTKREVRIQTLKAALQDAYAAEDAAWEKKQRDAEVRQARIYFDTLNEALKAGKDERVAKNLANNELTRAGLRRLDGQDVRGVSLSVRDKRLNEMTDALQAKFRSEMTAEELEQLELSEEHDKTCKKAGKVRK